MSTMSPTEARIYAIETRLRTEEIKRIEQQIIIKEDIDQVKDSLERISPLRDSHPQITELTRPITNHILKSASFKNRLH